MAIHMRWQPDAFAKVHAHDREPHLASHVVGVTMSRPSGLCYDIFGVYVPAKSSDRQLIYNHLKTKASKPLTIMLGD